MNEAQEVEQERDSIEHYLRALRKKVDHQLKNPFDFAFANYSFTELATWKNNVLQLDATSRLYGQRVDFLHNGTMQILGSVLNSEPQQSNEEKQQIKKQQIYDNAPYQRNLEQSDKINSQIVKVDQNVLLWREVCKKRDAISQLMLNELSTAPSLRLDFFPEEQFTNYESVLNNQCSIYMKLLDFKSLSLNLLQIYKEIEEAVSESNIFMINFNGKERTRGKDIKEQSFEFDFLSMDFGEPFQDRSFFVDQTATKEEEILMPAQEIHVQELAIIEEDDDEEDDQDNDNDSYFSLDEWNRSEKQARLAKRKKQKKPIQAAVREKKEELVNFIGINPFRHEVFLIKEQSEEERFLMAPDYLHVKIVKYINPYAKRQKKTANVSKRIKHTEMPTNLQTSFLNEQQSVPISFSPPNDETFNVPTTFSKIFRQNFKEAALSIKEMKKKIKERVHSLSLPSPKWMAFKQVKDYFKNEQPLDIFISLLHVAAEEQILLSI